MKGCHDRACLFNLRCSPREGGIDNWNLQRMERHHPRKAIMSRASGIGGQTCFILDRGINGLDRGYPGSMRGKKRHSPHHLVRSGRNHLNDGYQQRR